jgi:hypothetical protein
MPAEGDADDGSSARIAERWFVDLLTAARARAASRRTAQPELLGVLLPAVSQAPHRSSQGETADVLDGESQFPSSVPAGRPKETRTPQLTLPHPPTTIKDVKKRHLT